MQSRSWASLVIVSAATATASSDTVQIQSAVRGALTAQLTLEMPPSNYHGGAWTDAQRAQVDANIDQVLNRFYEPGAVRDRYAAALHRNVAYDANGSYRYLGGGIDDLRFDIVAINGDTANVVAVGTAWNRQGDSAGNVTAAPQTVNRFTMMLHRSTAGWRIVSELRDYVSGDRP